MENTAKYKNPFELPKPVQDKLDELQQIVNEHPARIPVIKAAKLLGMDQSLLRRAVDQCKVPFAIGCDNGKYGNRQTYIPTAPFYFWYVAPLLNRSMIV